MTSAPHNEHAERFVLAAALSRAWYDDIARVVPDAAMFYGERNQTMYRAIAALHAVGRGVDAVTIAAELRRADGIGTRPTQWNDEAIERFVGATPPEMLNYAAHADEVRAHWVRRETMRVAREAQIAAQDATVDAHDALDRAQSGLGAIAESATRTSPPSLATVATTARTMIADNRARAYQGGIAGIPTGIHALDRLTYGWIAPRLVLIAARTSIGKSALVLTSVRRAVLGDFGSIVYSNEESPAMIFVRLAAMMARVDGQHAIAGELHVDDAKRLETAMDVLADAPIDIVDASGWTALDIRAHARSVKRRRPVHMIAVDYIQRVKPIDRRAEMRHQIAATSSTLFNFTRDAGIVALAAAQLNRAAQSRHDKRPEQSDLRECGDLEQDADTIALIHRPEYDGKTIWDDTNTSCIGEARIMVTKQRGGATDPRGITVTYHKRWAEFADLEMGQKIDTEEERRRAMGHDW